MEERRRRRRESFDIGRAIRTSSGSIQEAVDQTKAAVELGKIGVEQAKEGITKAQETAEDIQRRLQKAQEGLTKVKEGRISLAPPKKIRTMSAKSPTFSPRFRRSERESGGLSYVPNP